MLTLDLLLRSIPDPPTLHNASKVGEDADSSAQSF